MPMKNWCIPAQDVKRLRDDLMSGELDTSTLAELSSAARTKILSKYVGEANAHEVNALFESKLLLKNQKQAMQSWAKSVMGPKQPAVKQTLIDKIQAMGKALTPETEDAFLSDLVAQKLGMNVTYEEVQKIADFAEKVKTAKEAMEAGPRRTKLGESPTPTEQVYGLAATDLREYVQGLGLEAKKLRLEDFKRNPFSTAGKVVMSSAGMSKSILASLDASYLFRQGFTTLTRNPEIWKRNAIQSFRDMVTAFGSHEVLRQVNADIVSRPTYPLMVRAKLPLGIHEEAFPETLQEKIPYVGALFRASDHAFTAFNQRNRADTFDKLLQIAQKTGVEVNDDELKSIGSLAASMTSRGNLGDTGEKVADLFNKVFFSPRNWKANLDTFTHPITGAGGSNFVRKQASLNLALKTAVIAATLLIARAIGGKEAIDWNLLSADSGKVKYKNQGMARIFLTIALDMLGFSTQTYSGTTRVDVTAGAGGLVTLASRMSPPRIGPVPLWGWQTKSSTTGKVTPLNSGKFGSMTVGDVVDRYFEGKFSPPLGLFRDVELRGQTYQGQKPTVGGEAKQLFEPLVFSTIEDLLDDQKNPHKPRPMH